MKWSIFFGVLMSWIVMGQSNETRPNLVFILADDLGYGDLGCYGNKLHRTPNIDRLAAEGAKFTDYYVTSPVCTPTRIALMSGKHPARFGSFGVLWPPTPGGLPTEEVTMAEWLRDHGYATGLVGKWHLGHQDPNLLPLAQGFDSWYGMPYSNDMGPFHPQTKWVKGEWPPMPMMRDRKIVQAPIDPNLLTQQFHHEALRFIKENQQRPFFLFLSHAMPHTLLGASKGFYGKSKNGLFGDAVEELDWSLGDIVDILRTLNLLERTLLVFTSDNGAALPKSPPPDDPRWYHGGSNRPLRDGKGRTFEGGVRVPAIFYWPGRIESGTVVRSPASILDTIPTFAELADIAPLSSAIDAVSIVSQLKGQQPQEQRTLFFGTGDARAVRRGQWKYLLTGDPSWKEEFKYEPMLYNLHDDPGETKNLVLDFPEVAKTLHQAIQQFQEESGPDMN